MHYILKTSSQVVIKKKKKKKERDLHRNLLLSEVFQYRHNVVSFQQIFAQTSGLQSSEVEFSADVILDKSVGTRLVKQMPTLLHQGLAEHPVTVQHTRRTCRTKQTLYVETTYWVQTNYPLTGASAQHTKLIVRERKGFYIYLWCQYQDVNSVVTSLKADSFGIGSSSQLRFFLPIDIRYNLFSLTFLVTNLFMFHTKSTLTNLFFFLLIYFLFIIIWVTNQL